MSTIVYVNNGRLEIRNKDGRLLRSVGTGFKQGDYNPQIGLAAVVATNGNVLIYDKDGRKIRTITRGASQAVFSGDDIVVTLQSGRVELRRLNGSLIRTI